MVSVNLDAAKVVLDKRGISKVKPSGLQPSLCMAACNFNLLSICVARSTRWSRKAGGNLILNFLWQLIEEHIFGMLVLTTWNGGGRVWNPIAYCAAVLLPWCIQSVSWAASQPCTEQLKTLDSSLVKFCISKQVGDLAFHKAVPYSIPLPARRVMKYATRQRLVWNDAIWSKKLKEQWETISVRVHLQTVSE